MTKWHLCVAFNKIYKDEVAIASLREGGGPPQVVEGAREHRKETFSPKTEPHPPSAERSKVPLFCLIPSADGPPSPRAGKVGLLRKRKTDFYIFSTLLVSGHD